MRMVLQFGLLENKIEIGSF